MDSNLAVPRSHLARAKHAVKALGQEMKSKLEGLRRK